MPLLLLLLLSLLWGIECVGSQGSQAGAGASTNPRSPRWYSDLEDGYQLQVQKSVTVQEGLCVFIPCIFSYPPDGWKDSDPVLGYWFQEQAYNFNHEQVAPVATNNPYRKVDSQTRDRFQLLGEPWNRSCSLVIRDAQRRDTATYFFRVERGNTVKFNFKKYTLALEVTGLTQKPDVYVPETLEPGRPVTLLCVFPGDFEGCPAPKFSWTGVAVSPQGAEPRASLFSALTLTPRPQDNDTELTCRVNFSRNGVSAMRTIRLSVAGRGEDTQTNTEGRQTCEDGGKDWSDASSSQETPRIAGNHQKLEEVRKDLPLEPSERAWPCQHLDFKLVVCRPVRQ
ncbi:sialic acid-binding Ig-like lectin 16 isoform 4-T5 [Trichechus inunguis]